MAGPAMRMISAAVIALGLSACSAVPERVTVTKTRTVVKQVRACPSDDAVREAAVKASIATYRQRQVATNRGSGACACPGDRYENSGRVVECATFPGPGLGVMCTRADVPATLVAAMREDLGC